MSTQILSLKEIEQLLAEGLTATKIKLTSIAGVDAAIVSDFIMRTQKRTALIISGFAAGEIDVQELKALMQDEKYILAGFLNTLEIVAKVDAQEIFKSTATTIAGIIVKIILPV